MPPKLPPTKYGLGEKVFTRVGDTTVPGIITGIKFTLDGGFYYTVTWGRNDTDHFEEELIQEVQF